MESEKAKIERVERIKEVLKRIDGTDCVVQKIIKMYLFGDDRNKKTYSIREIAEYFLTDEQTILLIIMIIMPKLDVFKK